MKLFVTSLVFLIAAAWLLTGCGERDKARVNVNVRSDNASNEQGANPDPLESVTNDVTNWSDPAIATANASFKEIVWKSEHLGFYFPGEIVDDAVVNVGTKGSLEERVREFVCDLNTVKFAVSTKRSLKDLTPDFAKLRGTAGAKYQIINGRPSVETVTVSSGTTVTQTDGMADSTTNFSEGKKSRSYLLDKHRIVTLEIRCKVANENVCEKFFAEENSITTKFLETLNITK